MPSSPVPDPTGPHRVCSCPRFRSAARAHARIGGPDASADRGAPARFPRVQPHDPRPRPSTNADATVTANARPDAVARSRCAGRSLIVGQQDDWETLPTAGPGRIVDVNDRLSPDPLPSDVRAPGRGAAAERALAGEDRGVTHTTTSSAKAAAAR